MYDVITLGGAVVDAFIETGLPEKSKQICVPVGSKLLVKNVWFSTGGGGTNTAAAFSKLGLKTGFIGRLGNDPNAEMILKELKELKVDFLGKQSNNPTGFSAILDSKENNRTILTYKGSNKNVKFSEVDLSKIKTKWIYLSSAIGETLKTEIKLARWASERGIKVAYNPSAYLTKENSKELKELIKHTTTLILNNEEARDIIPKGDVFQKLHTLGPQIVCITYGKKGNKVSDGSRVITAMPRKIKVRERTGAGDAFASGFVSGLIKFNDIKKAAAMGTLNAESAIQKPGAKNGLLNWKQISHQLKHYKIRVK